MVLSFDKGNQLRVSCHTSDVWRDTCYTGGWEYFIMRCAVYTRVSTDLQSEIEFNSCDSQKEQIIAFVNSQPDLEIENIYSDAGYSGSNLDRPAIQTLLNDISLKKIDCVLVYKIDRLTRSPRDFYNLIELFDKYDVSFISTTQRFDTSTATGRLIRNIILDFASFEREMTVERTRDKMYQRATKGLWNGGTVPYGYYRKDKKLFIHKEESKVIREIFKVFLRTQSLADTRRYINGKFKNRKNKDFSKSTVFSILRNAVYIGKAKHKDKLFPGIHKSIIPETTFLKVKTMIKKYTPRTETKINRNYLLTGLIRCSECGSVMTPTYTQKNIKGSKKYIYYYRCTKTYQHSWKSCSVRSVNAVKIEDFIIKKLKAVARDKKLITSAIKKINYEEQNRVKDLLLQEKSLKKKLQQTELKINNIVDTLADGGVKFNQVKKKMENLEDKRKLLQADLDENKYKIQHENLIKYDSQLVLDGLKNLAVQLETVGDTEKKHLLQLAIKKISYSKQDITMNLFYLPAITVNHGSKNHAKKLRVLNKYRTIEIRFINDIFRTNKNNHQPNRQLNHQPKNYSGQIPYGYNYNIKNGELIKNKIEQTGIKIIQELKQNNYSLREITRELNKRNIPTKNKGTWQANTIRKILNRINSQTN